MECSQQVFMLSIKLGCSLTEVTKTNLYGFVYLGVIGTGLAYALWFRGISKINATAVAYLGLLSPVVASLIGYLFLQETFLPIQLFGITIVLVAVFMGQKSKTKS